MPFDPHSNREIRTRSGRRSIREARALSAIAAKEHDAEEQRSGEAWPRQVAQRTERPESCMTIGANCLLILAEALVVLFGVGFWLGSMLMVDVLNEIRQRDFGEPLKRIGAYQEFFGGLRKAGCKVVEDKPRITTPGITTYLWTVEPRGGDDLCRFQWRHVIETNQIEAQTNGALLLDLQLKYINGTEAAQYPFYNPDDPIALALLEGRFAVAQNLPAPGDGLAGASPGVGPPLVTPEEAKRRAGRSKPKEETTPADGTEQPGDGDSEPPQVEDPNAPPTDGGGEKPPVVEQDGGGGDDGGGETPPHDGGGETPPPEDDGADGY